MKETLQEQLRKIVEQEPGQTTAVLAKKIGRSRSMTSLYLNELLRSGLITKESGRPVRWIPTNRETNPAASGAFTQFVGADGSLQSVIQQVKSAVLYPPMGMPILLHGHSGVGKTYLAQVIADYLKEQDAPNAEGIVTFNCADYANNPELLSSILFGYVKGAFTGADKASEGLLKQADHGILFLDEIHRLSFENQEKLFQFIDRGYFHPLGDEKTMIHAKVRLLFATTEDPKQVLLPTFYRRIPLTVELADFDQRPRMERMLLAGHLFSQEGQQIQKPLAIEVETLNRIVDAQYIGNIGSLKNRIKLLCANSLQVGLEESEALIVSDEAGWADHQQTVAVERLLNPNMIVQVEQHRESAFWQMLLETSHLKERQHLLEQRIREWQEETMTVQQQLRQQAIEELLTKRWQQKLGRTKAMDYCAVALAHGLACSTDLTEGFNEALKQLTFDYPRTTALAYQLLDESDFNTVPLLMILGTLLIDEVSEAVHYQGLLVAHGESTASSIQKVVNRLLDDYLFDAIDMPLEASVTDIVEQTKSWLNERDTSAGVIMMVDMGSLTQLYEQLKPQIHGQLLVVNHLTTAYALELGHAIQQQADFSAIAQEMEQLPSPAVQYFEGFAFTPNVIVSSLSGGEITTSLANIFAKYLYTNIQVIPLEFNELGEVVEQALDDESYLSSTQVIITMGTSNLPPQLNTLNIMDLIGEGHSEQALSPLVGLMSEQSYPRLISDLLHLFSKEGLKEKLIFLNPDIIISQVEQVIEKIERRFQYVLDPEMKFLLMMHLAVMVERTLLENAHYEVPVDPKTLTFNEKPFYPTMQGTLYDIEQFYHITINDWEIYILYEIMQGMRD
ncbi:MAG: sigma 54-interacting transcriptional regulator [Aerococcus sp.]|nr:sigma 54-interacting transcriptional regulator [Aerococcus sp.]